MISRITNWLKVNKWLVAGITTAVFNPLPSGVILGIVMVTEDKFAKIGKTVLLVSVALIIISFLIFLIFRQDKYPA